MWVVSWMFNGYIISIMPFGKRGRAGLVYHLLLFTCCYMGKQTPLLGKGHVWSLQLWFVALLLKKRVVNSGLVACVVNTSSHKSTGKKNSFMSVHPLECLQHLGQDHAVLPLKSTSQPINTITVIIPMCCIKWAWHTKNAVPVWASSIGFSS